MRASDEFFRPVLLAGLLAALFVQLGCSSGGNDSTTAGGTDGNPQPAAFPSLIPGPGQPGYDANLEALARQYERQFHTFNAAAFEMSLDAYIAATDEAGRSLVEQFLAGDHGIGPDAFFDFAGKRVFDLVTKYDEHGDLGMFGGVAAMGDAYRYAVLRDNGGEPALVEEARGHVIRIMQALHLFQALTGTPGVLVRGIRLRNTPIGGPEPATVPLFDEHGNPLPPEKDKNVWRSDQSGQHPEWMWVDNTSKDQMDGYFLAQAALFEVTASDPSIPQSLKDDLAADALSIARGLMQVAPETGLDLTIRDADGRLVKFHDLNPAELTPDVVLPACCQSSGNGFNALLALHNIKVAATITGDAELEDFYYAELLGRRDFIRIMRETLSLVSFPPIVNGSNYNMAMVAIYDLLRFEADPEIRAAYQELLDGALWDPGGQKPVSEQGQSLFNFIYAGMRAGGTDQSAVDAGVQTLKEFVAPPYWNYPVMNCTTEEEAQNNCRDLEGNPMPVAYWNDRYKMQAVHPVPKRLRPANNFEWRSSPYTYNDYDPAAGYNPDRFNPGGDFLGAYWLGRYLKKSEDNLVNLSPLARPAPDRDADGRIAWKDNCPAAFNPDQQDADRDGLGDVCDPRPEAPVLSSVAGGVSTGVPVRVLLGSLLLFLIPILQIGLLRRSLRNRTRR